MNFGTLSGLGSVRTALQGLGVEVERLRVDGVPGPQGQPGPSGSGPAFGNPGATFYVSPGGNDSNDGLTWNSSVHHILEAIDRGLALAAGVGVTIYVADGSHVGDEVANQGLWLCGNMDPSQYAPALGWRFTDRRQWRFVGVGAASFSLSMTAIARILPGTTGVWGTNCAAAMIHVAGNTTGITFENIAAYQPGPGPCVVAGIGTDGVDRATAVVNFRRCAFASKGQPTQEDTLCGPTMRFANAWWVSIEDSTVLANGSAPIGDDRRAAILCSPVDPSTFSTYLINGRNLNFQHGGVIHRAGITGWDSRWEHIFVEGDGAHPLPPVVRITGTVQGGGKVKVEDVYSGDAYWTPPDYRVDLKVDDGTPADVYALNVPCIEGRVNIVSPGHVNYQQFARAPGTRSPAIDGVAGVMRGRLYGQSDAGRRAMAPVPARYENLALPFGGAPQPAPDGSLRAMLAPFNNVGTYAKYGNRTFTPGDYFVFGAWVRNATALGDPRIQFYAQTAGAMSMVVHGVQYTKANAALDVNRVSPALLEAVSGWSSISDGTEFTWVGGWARVVTSSVADAVFLHFEDHGGSGLVVFGPTFYYVPAADGWTDSEIAAWANDLHPSPSAPTGSTVKSPAPGDLALWPGQRLAFWDATTGVWKYLRIDNGAVVIE